MASFESNSRGFTSLRIVCFSVLACCKLDIGERKRPKPRKHVPCRKRFLGVTATATQTEALPVPVDCLLKTLQHPNLTKQSQPAISYAGASVPEPQSLVTNLPCPRSRTDDLIHRSLRRTASHSCRAPACVLSCLGMDDLQQLARGLTACLCSLEVLQPLRWWVPAIGCEEVTLDGRRYRTLKQVGAVILDCGRVRWCQAK